MNGAICGGQHSTIKTKDEWVSHVKNIDPLTCLDCMCGIGFTDMKGRYWNI